MRLTGVQREVLETLVKLYDEKKRMIKSKEVANLLGKDEGTVRNIILSLKSLGLVTSKTGPTGGYVPTLKAYEVLYEGLGMSIGYGKVKVYLPNGILEYIATSVEVLGLFSPGSVKALVSVSGRKHAIPEGTKVRVESTPYPNIVLEGTLIRVNETPFQFLIGVSKLSIIPNDNIGKIIRRRKLISIPSNASIREAAGILFNNGIRGGPVVDENGNVVGFLTTTDIAMLVSRGIDTNEPVYKYMRRNVFTISENDTVMEAIRLMESYGVGRLLVIDAKGGPVGIITRTDILRFISGLERG
jgi:predicted transcriptional regulator